ncbi:MAG: hypothetical protein L0Z55_03400 [Planctomycetes bacterium]|nr:hypothetical protein [Planctomycetota bacterium]
MSEQVLLFVAVTVTVGLVSLAVSGESKRSLVREFVSYLAIVVGGIALFTGGIVALSAAFQ